MPGTIARRYSYQGKVQGIGFRRVTEAVALDFQVTGYVMNKSDGSVEVHVEGPVQEIDHFADRIQKTFDGKISRVTQELVEACEFNQFSVTFEKGRREL